jgi:SAM-dependent methyltransferase
LHLFNSGFGSIAYIPEITAIYRDHGQGVMSGKTTLAKWNLWDTATRFVKKTHPQSFRKELLQSHANSLFQKLKYLKRREILNFQFLHIALHLILHRKAVGLTVTGILRFALGSYLSPRLKSFVERRMPLRFKNKFCNICEQKIHQFRALPSYYFKQWTKYATVFSEDDYETLNCEEYECPRCGASDRDRLLFNYTEKSRQLSNQENILDFSPSATFRSKMKNKFGTNYISVNDPQEADYQSDITNLKEFKTEQFSFFICSHILEHVNDPTVAVRELFRILRPGGEGLILVPLPLSLVDTIELRRDAPEALRWRLAGQGDHQRMFSKKGLMQTLETAGFRTELIKIAPSEYDFYSKFGISLTSCIYRVTK